MRNISSPESDPGRLACPYQCKSYCSDPTEHSSEQPKAWAFLICSFTGCEVTVLVKHDGAGWVRDHTVGPDFEPRGAQRWQREARGPRGRHQTADTNVYTTSEAIIIQPINADRA